MPAIHPGSGRRNDASRSQARPLRHTNRFTKLADTFVLIEGTGHSRRMVARSTIVLAGATLLSSAIAIWWQLGPRITNEFSIGDLGEPAVGVRDLAAGLGRLSGGAISNAFVEHNTALSGKAGRYSSAGSHHGRPGEREPWQAEFRQGPWAPIEQQLFDRDLRMRSGSKLLSYSVAMRGAITNDGSQWLFAPQVLGTGEDFSLLADCHFFPMSRALTVTITERIGTEQPRSYSVVYEVDFDGELRLRLR